MDSYGAAVNVSPFAVKVPDVPRLGIWPAAVGFDDKKRAAWLDTLELVQLRALQGRLKLWGESAARKLEAEGRSIGLDMAFSAMDHDSDLIWRAIDRWLELGIEVTELRKKAGAA